MSFRDDKIERDKKDELDSTLQLYTLPVMGKFPDKIVVSEESKRLFKREEEIGLKVKGLQSLPGLMKKKFLTLN